jgi:hypothetical protein
MDPFIRKMILGGVAFLGTMLLMGGAASTIYFHNRPQCSETVVSDLISPDGRWRATLMERRCGEESPFYTHVNLRRAGDPIHVAYFSGRSEEGEIFLAEEETQNMWPQLEWTSPGDLTIHCPRCRPYLVEKRDQRWGPISLRYHFEP